LKAEIQNNTEEIVFDFKDEENKEELISIASSLSDCEEEKDFDENDMLVPADTLNVETIEQSIEVKTESPRPNSGILIVKLDAFLENNQEQAKPELKKMKLNNSYKKLEISKDQKKIDCYFSFRKT